MNKATISIEIDPLSFQEAERYRAIFLALISSGALNVKSGSATMHFDLEGSLQEIEVKFIRKWRKQSERLQKAL